MNDRSAAEEQEGLEERVRHQVKRTRGEGADAHRREHVPELRHGRVREDALDVVLNQADRRGHQRGEDAHNRDNRHHFRRVREEDGIAAEHVDTGGDHRRRVDQRRHRRRTFHRVRQPDVEGNLRALAGRADEQEQADQRQDAEMAALDRHRRRGILNGSEIERAEGVVDEKDAEDEAPVADAVGDERFLPGVRRALLLVPVADQQVRAQAHAFPAHEHHQEVASQDEHEHEEAEQVQVAEEARDAAARLVGHVGGRIDVNQRPDPGDDEQHHRRERIEPESPRHFEVAEAVMGRERNLRNPRRDVHVVGARVRGQPEQLPERDNRQRERRRHRRAGDKAGGPAGERTNPHEAVDGGPGARQKRDQPDVLHVYRAGSAGSAGWAGWDSPRANCASWFLPLLPITISSSSFHRCLSSLCSDRTPG